MSSLKGLLIIVTMLAGGSSLAMASSESTLGTPPAAASGARNPAALQHLAKMGGIGHSGSASNTEATSHGHKGHYKSGQ
jgi:hypothetical protein